VLLVGPTSMAISASPNATVFAAIGMVTAPFNSGRRTQVRSTMLRYEAVRSGRMVFRFIIGDEIHHSKAHAQGAPAQLVVLRAEMEARRDIVQLTALDGSAIEVACSCVEKTTSWIRHALKAWPSATFIAKTVRVTTTPLVPWSSPPCASA
jgi:hypothetical protein